MHGDGQGKIAETAKQVKGPVMGTCTKQGKHQFDEVVVLRQVNLAKTAGFPGER